MTLTELTNIIRTANKKTIIASIKQLGYIDCTKDKKLRRANLCDIMKGKTISTATFPTKNGKYEYYGDICTTAKGFENLEFVIININKVYKDKNLSFPYKIFTFAKEIKL